MAGPDPLDTLFIVWAFFLQIVLIIHFAISKQLYESYTVNTAGWYMLSAFHLQ